MRAKGLSVFILSLLMILGLGSPVLAGIWSGTLSNAGTVGGGHFGFSGYYSMVVAHDPSFTKDATAQIAGGKLTIGILDPLEVYLSFGVPTASLIKSILDTSIPPGIAYSYNIGSSFVAAGGLKLQIVPESLFVPAFAILGDYNLYSEAGNITATTGSFNLKYNISDVTSLLLVSKHILPNVIPYGGIGAHFSTSTSQIGTGVPETSTSETNLTASLGCEAILLPQVSVVIEGNYAAEKNQAYEATYVGGVNLRL
jgi:hypothetical protein